MDLSTLSLDRALQVAVLVAVVFLAALVYFLVKREIRKGIAGLIERLGRDIKDFLESTKSEVKPIIKEGFVTAGNGFAVTFADTMKKIVVPAIQLSIRDASAQVWTSGSLEPVDIEKGSPETTANIQVFVDSDDYDGVVAYIESMPDRNRRASYYHELALVYMSKQDRYKSVSAAHKHKEITGDTPEGYGIFAYVYWWFGDFDTAIAHAEHALRLASALPNGSAKHTVLGKIYNGLAYYYAEKEIKKEEAFSYIERCFEQPFVDSKRTAADLDTRGFVRLKFTSSEGEINSAITDFNQALEIEPDNILVMKHLQEAYKKKKK
jgi:Tfp pilus assembly protein PilF